MEKRTLRQIRDDIENVGAITNKATLLAALPLVVEMTERIRSLRSTLVECAKDVAELSDSCSKYALNHVSSLFMNGLITDGKGVMHGDVEAENAIYHFAAGYGKFIRTDGDNITQGFLTGLPEGWTKAKLELDTTAINRLGVTEKELEKAGIVKSANNVWSVSSGDVDQSE